MPDHKYIFQDIYEWEGNERTVEIEKFLKRVNCLLIKLIILYS